MTANTWYVDLDRAVPIPTSRSGNLQACASPGLFYDAGVDSSNLGGALQTLFNTVVQTAHLTQ